MYDSCYNWGKQVDVVIHFCDGMCFTLSGSKSVKFIYIYSVVGNPVIKREVLGFQ
jgi:hypothetical protein